MHIPSQLALAILRRGREHPRPRCSVGCTEILTLIHSNSTYRASSYGLSGNRGQRRPWADHKPLWVSGFQISILNNARDQTVDPTWGRLDQTASP
jgi:hypothetical protein